ncbi:uncharacterized protein J7T54_006744 [Emericellopsis cladophorae]|uniref:Thioredoxin domain-containing protein n=1 Tax=Emericellopsis cladophorae TaxID=2686198 RepID=A0A9Q0BGJ8_9HYPO|nr:uncharacterized protein J7T54_006744 [Emericellopsis cladophorae]KAI6785102.1 hypothetical protein J7T54_006744 [Emericellopsis cladophorae]
MRFSPLTILTAAAALAKGQSLDPEAINAKKATVFNDIKVPPLMDLTPSNFDDEIKKTKYMLVKHYSPYCPHCIDYAPTFQTLYEFYYTSLSDGDGDASFLEYYDFRFGMINCIAYYDLCVKNGVQTYPMTSLFEDGVAIENLRGVKSIDDLGDTMEAVLEKERPGSRPRSIQLPKAGAHYHPGKTDETTAESPEKANKESAAGAEAETGKAEENVDTKKDNDKEAQDADKTDKAGSDATGASDAKWKSPTPAEVFNNRRPKKPTTTPNPNGASTSLSAESFPQLVTKTQDPWFIKFYAPWCPHCQAMGPTWDQLSKSMQGKLNVGEVNCDKEPRLCKEANAHSYPTILFFKGGERAEYHGLRGLGDFISYAESALDLASGVPDVTVAEFEALEEKEDVIFTYFYDHATTTEDFTALESLPLSLIGHAKLVKTNDPKLAERFKVTTWPRLLVSRDGRPTYYEPITPDAMRDIHGLMDWMSSVWLPLVPELTAANAKQIMDDKIVVLGILKRDDATGFPTALKEIKLAANEWMDRQILEFQLERKKLRDAKQMRIEEAADRGDERALRNAKLTRIDMNEHAKKEVGFAWVDGVFWQRWIRTTYGIDVVQDGERVIINDQDVRFSSLVPYRRMSSTDLLSQSRQYWDQTATGNYIMVSRTAISESLDKIVYGPSTIKAKLTVSLIEKFFLDIRKTFVRHPYLSVGSVGGLLLAAWIWLRGRVRRSKGHFRLDEPVHGMKDGLGLGLIGQQISEKTD